MGAWVNSFDQADGLAGASAGLRAGTGTLSSRAAKKSPSSSSRIDGNGLDGPSPRCVSLLCRDEEVRDAGVGDSLPSSEAGGVGRCARGGTMRVGGCAVGGMS